MPPTHKGLLLPKPVNSDIVIKALKTRHDKAIVHYNQSCKDQPPLESGSKVRIRPGGKKQWRKAEVLPRSYIVQDERGRVFRRDRRRLTCQCNCSPNHQHSVSPAVRLQVYRWSRNHPWFQMNRWNRPTINPMVQLSPPDQEEWSENPKTYWVMLSKRHLVCDRNLLVKGGDAVICPHFMSL